MACGGPLQAHSERRLRPHPPRRYCLISGVSSHICLSYNKKTEKLSAVLNSEKLHNLVPPSVFHTRSARTGYRLHPQFHTVVYMFCIQMKNFGDSFLYCTIKKWKELPASVSFKRSMKKGYLGRAPGRRDWRTVFVSRIHGPNHLRKVKCRLL